MSPISTRFGKIFKRRDPNDKTPPKALYDDLESAHESITRKASSTHSQQARCPPLASQKSDTALNSSPIRSPIITRTIYRRTPTPALALPSQSSYVLQNRYEVMGRERGSLAMTDDNGPFSKSAARFNDDADVARASLAPYVPSRNDAGSQWQTVTTGSTIDLRLGHKPAVQNPSSTTRFEPQAQRSSGASSYYATHMPTMSPFLKASGNDTVDDILQGYTQTTPKSSLDAAQQDEPPNRPTSKRQARGMVHGSDASLPHPNRRAAVANLGQFAWSPCPSGMEDNDVESRENFHSLDALDDDSQHGKISSTDMSSSSSNASYGNTRQLLELSSSQPSKDASSNGNIHRPHDTSSNVKPSSFAGDLNLANSEASNIVSESSLRSVGRFSGIISDGTSSRPMSQAELEESLSIFVHSALRASTVTNASGKMNTETGNDEERDLVREAAAVILGPRFGDLTTSAHLHTSRTSSSHFEILSGSQNTRSGVSLEPASSPIRKKTPPGLFGRRLPLMFKKTPQPIRLTVARKNSRLAQAAAAAGIKENGRLGKALASSPKQDWVTETDIALHSEHPDMAHRDSITGSSPADCSHAADLSYTDSSSKSESQMNGKGPRQRHIHPRYNHSWSLVKNQRTGSIAMIPDYISREGSRLPNVSAKYQARNLTNPGPSLCYQHPKPLPKDHPHPLSTSPRMSPSCIQIRDHGNEKVPTIQQQRMQKGIETSELFYEGTGSDHDSDTGSLYQTSHVAIRGGHAAAAGGEDSFQVRTLRRYPSSAWLSSVSEVESGEPSLPPRISSFAKSTVLGKRGNLTGTPEGTGAREVGSSLADGSSPREHFSSSPPNYASSPQGSRPSPIHDASRPDSRAGSAISAFHRQLEDIGAVGNGQKRCARLTPRDLPNHGAEKSRPLRQLLGNSSPSNRPQRKKGKNYGFQVQQVLRPDSPLPKPPYSIAAPQFGAEVKSHSLATIDRFDVNDRIDWSEYLPALGHRRTVSLESHERRNMSAVALKAAVLQRGTGSKNQKRQSVVGLSKNLETGLKEVENGTFELATQRGSDHLHVGVRSGSRTPPSVHGNGISFDASPRLYDNICMPDETMKAQHKRYSQLWAFVCIAFPFLGPLFGHGYLDRIMVWHSDGAIAAFRSQEKLVVLFYSYIVFVGVLVALAVAMVVASK